MRNEEDWFISEEHEEWLNQQIDDAYEKVASGRANFTSDADVQSIMRERIKKLSGK